MSCPIAYAKRMVERQGITGAKRILSDCSREQMGQDGSGVNPFYRWYREALRYVLKRYPEES